MPSFSWVERTSNDHAWELEISGLEKGGVGRFTLYRKTAELTQYLAVLGEFSMCVTNLQREAEWEIPQTIFSIDITIDDTEK